MLRSSDECISHESGPKRGQRGNHSTKAVHRLQHANIRRPVVETEASGRSRRRILMRALIFKCSIYWSPVTTKIMGLTICMSSRKQDCWSCRGTRSLQTLHHRFSSHFKTHSSIAQKKSCLNYSISFMILLSTTSTVNVHITIL